MLEVLSKNGSTGFHEYLAQEDFMKEFMKCFKLLRGRGGLLSRFESKSNRALREKLQDQGLYLLQLWADTFMMYQDTYPGFQKYYRELKVEGIQFPERDLNERTMMENLTGISSPMFDFIEQQTKQKEAKPVQEERKSALAAGPEPEGEEPEDQITENLETQILKLDEKIQTLTGMQDYIEEQLSDFEEIDQANYSKYEKEIFDQSEFDIAKNNIEILENMSHNCENFADICTNVVVELFKTALKSVFRLEKIVEVRKKAKFSGEKEVALTETIRMLHTKMEDFRHKYIKLKKKEQRGFENKKKVLSRQLKKENKEKAKQERREKRRRDKQEKINQQKERNEQEDKNPFGAIDESEQVIGGDRQETGNDMNNSDESSDEKSESSEEDHNEEHDSSDSDGLHKPVSMWSILYNRKNKSVKPRPSKESKMKEEENPRSSKVSSSNYKVSASGGFLRNSVLVQKTLNFFGRKSKPLLNNQSSEDEENKLADDEGQKKSDFKPELNDYFVQTANKSESDKKNEVFENVQEEVVLDALNKPDDEAEEVKEANESDEQTPVFEYKENVK